MSTQTPSTVLEGKIVRESAKSQQLSVWEVAARISLGLVATYAAFVVVSTIVAMNARPPKAKET